MIVVREKCHSCKRLHNSIKRMFRSMVTLAKVSLFFLNLWVLAVVLVVTLGHWRVFESGEPAVSYENSHLVVMRELNEEGSNNIAPALTSMKVSVPAVNPLPPMTVEVLKSPEAVPVPEVKPDTVMSNVRRLCKQQHPHLPDPKNIDRNKLNQLYVDEKHKFLFCSVPGVHLNEWRKVLLILTGVVNTTKPEKISGGDIFGKYSKSVKRLSDIKSAETRGKMLKDFYKVMFVRDPFDRLLFTYYSKMKSKYATYFHGAFGSNIIKKYRKKASAADVKSGSSVTFSEFAQYIVDVEHQGEVALNEHWQQFYKQCHPCLVNYDFIGKVEHAVKDADTVLAKLKVKHLFTSPVVSDQKSFPKQELMKYYGSLSPKTLNQLFKVYSPDYTLFGYQCPSFLHDLMKQAHISHDY